jgi:LuxR family maltose regulon positive regulatory protein
MDYQSFLIPTKLKIPQIRGNLVERPQLIEKLKLGLNRKVTIISAPAGYGKSTLTINFLKKQSRPVAWFSISKTDNDLNNFLNYLVTALQTLFPDSFQRSKDLLAADIQPPIHYFTTILINDINAIPAGLSVPSFIVVLDDYHLIENQEIHQLISSLIEYQPQQMHLVIIGRQDPFQLPISQLRARQELLEIRQADIRFNLVETRQFLDRNLGADLSEELVDLVDQRIEGWVVGLRLASMTLQDFDDPQVILQGMKGTHRYVMEYLLDEVLLRQPQAIQAFILKTSILERFCASLGEHLAELVHPQYHGFDYIDWLEKTNLFVISLDDRREWYRYHHLFKELLQNKLKEAHTEREIKELHVRASQWFSEEDHLEEAIQHALAADDIELAVKIVEKNSQNLLNRWERHILEEWISNLPDLIVWDRPKLLLVQAWLLFREFRITDLNSVLDRMEYLLDSAAGTMSREDATILSGQIFALQCATQYLIFNEFPESLAYSKKALSRLPKQVAGARSVALAFGALSLHALGHLDQAIDQLNKVLGDSAPFGPAKVQAFISLSLIHLHSCDLIQMRQISDRFLAWANKTKEANAVQGANYVAGLLNYELNELQTAEFHLKKAIDLRYRANFSGAFNAGLCLARIYQIQGELDQSQNIIDELRDFTLRIDNLDLLPGLEAGQAELWLYQANIPVAKRWAQSHQKETIIDKVFKFDLPLLTQARILMNHGSEAEIQTIRRHLELEIQTPEAKNLSYRTIQTLAHLAQVYNRLNMSDEAMAALRRAITHAQKSGLVRTFLDCDSGLMPLLEQLVGSDLDDDYIRQLLALFDTDNEQSEQVTNYSIDPLTRREHEILQLIADGLTNQEIADELFISLNTVKNHNSNIYHKLAVKNRREAIRKARQQNISL